MLTIIQTELHKKLTDYLEANKHLLVPDVSNYAKGRFRAWIGCEAPLIDKQTFKPAPFGYDSALWYWLDSYCNKYLDFKPELGLVHIGGADCSEPEAEPVDGRGGECGIKMHRDAGYADYRAVGINIKGEATFGYRNDYKDQDKWSRDKEHIPKLQIVNMVPGTCIVFNCKNPHFAQVGPNRWCINAWRISAKRRQEFYDYCSSLQKA